MPKITIKPLFIVGNIQNDEFKQAEVRSGYTGTRVFKRLCYAKDFLAETGHEKCQLFCINEVEVVRKN